MKPFFREKQIVTGITPTATCRGFRAVCAGGFAVLLSLSLVGCSGNMAPPPPPGPAAPSGPMAAPAAPVPDNSGATPVMANAPKTTATTQINSPTPETTKSGETPATPKTHTASGETQDPDSKAPENKAPDGNTPATNTTPAAPTATATPAAPPVAANNKPADKKLKIAYAGEILAAARNPFMSKLPKPEKAVEAAPADDGTPAEPVPSAPDPLQGINLVGIIYNKTTPMALLSLGSEASDTKFVRKGEVISIDGQQVKVTGISHDTVDLLDVAKPDNKRNVVLQNIVGYTSTKSGEASTPVGDLNTLSEPKSANEGDGTVDLAALEKALKKGSTKTTGTKTAASNKPPEESTIDPADMEDEARRLQGQSSSKKTKN